MHPLTPLFGVLVLAGVLTLNYFRTAWRLGLLRAFGRRATLNWRVLTAGSLAACLPLAGALMAMAITPTDVSGKVQASASELALMMSLCGLALHALNDAIVRWGAPRASA